MPTGCIENTFVAELSRTTVGFFKPSIRCRPTSKLAGVDLPPFFVPGVMRVGIGQRVLSFVFACAAGAQAQPERKQHTRRRREPPRTEHDGQSVGQRLHQLERQAARPNHHRRPELDGIDARIPQDLADLVTTTQMRRKFRIVVVAQPSQIDNW